MSSRFCFPLPTREERFLGAWRNMRWVACCTSISSCLMARMAAGGDDLGGGLKHFLFLPLPREMIQFD